MITQLDIYWITRLDEIKHLCIPFIVLLGIMIIVFLIIGITNYFLAIENDKKSTMMFAKKVLNLLWFTIPIFSFFLAINTFVPSTKEAIAIYAIPKIANNEDIQQVPANFAKLINGKLQEWMKDVDIIK